ncbi:MAG: glycosyltransferase [Candidatus Limnocylindrales bacterium]
MRLLIASTPALGHLLPLLPLAREAAARGHEVRVAVGASLEPVVVAAGFRHEPVGPATLRDVVAGIPDVAGLTGRRRAVVVFRQGFCGPIATGIADDILALGRTWRPDVIVHEDMAFGSWIAAERLGIPHITVQATAWRPRMRDLATAPLNELRERHGLAPDPELSGLYGATFFTTRPPSLRDPDVPLLDVTAELRPIADDRDAAAGANPPAVDPFPPADGRPRIAVTLGTVNAGEREVMQAIVAGAAATGAHVVVALGADPATLGEVPTGVTVHRYVPMSTLLPAADLVAFHGGSGTMLAALAAARPMVIVPLAADQPDNADLCERAGVARVVPLETLTADGVRDAIADVLAQLTFRERATALAAEIAAMPGPDAAMDRIESIVATR